MSCFCLGKGMFIVSATIQTNVTNEFPTPPPHPPDSPIPSCNGGVDPYVPSPGASLIPTGSWLQTILFLLGYVLLSHNFSILSEPKVLL